MRGGKHCYPNSDVLVNKYDIHDKKLLEKLEVQKTTIKLLGLDVRPERIHATLDITHLKAIHEYLFEHTSFGKVMRKQQKSSIHAGLRRDGSRSDTSLLDGQGAEITIA